MKYLTISGDMGEYDPKDDPDDFEETFPKVCLNQPYNTTSSIYNLESTLSNPKFDELIYWYVDKFYQDSIQFNSSFTRHLTLSFYNHSFCNS